MEEIINFHGNCIYKIQTNYNLNQDEKKAINSLTLNPLTPKPSATFISTDKQILNNLVFENLKTLFKDYINHYVKDILQLNHELKLTNSWLTLNRLNSSHFPHDHPNVLFSLCFYPQIESGDIVFESIPPHISNFNFHYNIIKINEFNSRKFKINLSKGDLIIFPGWLKHYSTPNMSQTNRIMIGSNYFLTGDLGTTQNTTNLNLG